MTGPAPAPASTSARPAAAAAAAAAAAPKHQTKLAIPFPDDARSGGLSIVGILAHAEPLGALFPRATVGLRSASSFPGSDGGRAGAGSGSGSAPAAAAAPDTSGSSGAGEDTMRAEAEKAASDAVLDPAVALEQASSGAAAAGAAAEVARLGARPRPEPKPLALILHGVLAHKDQIYHKKLVAALEMDSFRFDFRANHETPGEWNMATFDEDVRDMRCVIAHLRRYFNYRVHVLIAHSRGALDAWTYLGEQERNRRQRRRRQMLEAESPVSVGATRLGAEEEALRILEEDVPPYVVSLSGRWRMERIYDRIKMYEEGFKAEGFYRWKARVAGKDVEVRITPEQVEAFARYPIAEYVRDAPLESDFLLITGTADKVVPTSDVAYYLNAVGSQAGRRPGSVQMHLVEHADHNFVGHYDEVVATIVDWLRARKQQAKTLLPAAAENDPGHAQSAATIEVVDSAGAGLIPSRATATAGAGGGKL